MLQFDRRSILERLRGYFREELGGLKILFFGTNEQLLAPIAMEMAEQMRYVEYLTRESKWSLARQVTSVLAQTEFFDYDVHRKRGAHGPLEVSADEEFNGDHAVSIEIDKYTVFSDGQKDFVADKRYVLSPDQDYITIDIVQGTPRTYTFEVTSSAFPSGTEYAKFTIDNDSIEDTLYDLRVNGVPWEEIEHIRMAEDNESQVYTLRNLTDFSGIEIRFGNGVFGRKLEVGDMVTFDCLVTEGEEGDVLEEYAIDQVEDTITDVDGNEVELFCRNPEVVANGADVESIESIRANAPRSYQTGDRAMTTSDYSVIILRENLADRVSVWGEREINEDEGNPPGTYLPSAENLIHISGFNINADGTGRRLTSNDRDEIRSVLNELKGPTDILQFIPAEFVYLIFDATVFVKDREYSLEQVRSNTIDALASEYKLEKQSFNESLFFSQYTQFINGVEGVHYHKTSVSFAVFREFSSAYEFSLDINLQNIKPNTFKIFVRTDPDDEWTHIASDDGSTNIVGEPIDPDDEDSDTYDLPGAEINYDDGSAGDITVTYGLEEEYTIYDIMVTFELTEQEEGHLRLRSRQQIYAYWDSDVEAVLMD